MKAKEERKIFRKAHVQIWKVPYLRRQFSLRKNVFWKQKKHKILFQKEMQKKTLKNINFMDSLVPKCYNKVHGRSIWFCMKKYKELVCVGGKRLGCSLQFKFKKRMNKPSLLAESLQLGVPIKWLPVGFSVIYKYTWTISETRSTPRL